MLGENSRRDLAASGLGLALALALAMAPVSAEASTLEEFCTHFFTKEFSQLLVFRCTGFIFDSGINVFGIFSKDNCINIFRAFHG